MLNIDQLMAEMHALVSKYSFGGLMALTSKFHFLVALGHEWGGAKVLHPKILFQCNCHKYWKRCACAHALLVGTHLRPDAGGFNAEFVPEGGTQLPMRCSRKTEGGSSRQKEDAEAAKIHGLFRPKH